MDQDTFGSCFDKARAGKTCAALFFYKNKFYKNNEAQNWCNLRIF